MIITNRYYHTGSKNEVLEFGADAQEECSSVGR